MPFVGEDDDPAPLRLAQPKSYTLAEVTKLAAEWIDQQEGDTDMLRWTFSICIEWLKRREKENQ